MTRTNRVRPLSVRPGARFDCFGDGSCCTDIHALGPVGPTDAERLALIHPQLLVRSGDGERFLRTREEDGCCIFLGPEDDDGMRPCQLHASLGEAMKPVACRRFPFGLTATPKGGRITTHHCCPCRTLGSRPALTIESALPSLVDVSGRLWATHRVGGTVALTARSRVSFARYEELEAQLLARLAEGEDPATVLDARPFPALRGSSWTKVGEDMRDLEGDTRLEVALYWFADALLARDGVRAVPRTRPWSAGFERAMRRSEGEDPNAMWADWVADCIWDMMWTSHGPFDRARKDLATRYAVGRAVERRLRRAKLPPARAAAEAIMVVDLVGACDVWDEIVSRIS